MEITVRPIHTEAEYDAALSLVDTLMDAEPGTADGDALGKFNNHCKIKVTVAPRTPHGARAYQHDPADAPVPQPQDLAPDLAGKFTIGFSRLQR